MKSRSDLLVNILVGLVALGIVIMRWDVFQQWFVFVATLGGLVAIHEWGHFIAARSAGVRVYEFALGMGPKLITYMRRAGTDYTIRALPIGGFVNPKGMQPDDPITPDGLSGRRPAERALVYLAGPLMNAILGVFLLLFMGFFFGTPNESKQIVAEVQRKRPASRMEVRSVNGQPVTGYQKHGLQVGDLILEVNGRPVNRKETIFQEIHPNGGKPVTMKVQRGKDVLELTGVPEKGNSGQEQFIVVTGVPAGTKLAVRPGDQIDFIDGKFPGSRDEAPEAAVRRILKERQGQPITLTVWRNSDTRLVLRGPASPLEIAIRPGKRIVGQLGFGPIDGQGARVSLGQSFRDGAGMLTMFFVQLKGMFSRPKQLKESVGGPVAIWSQLGQVGKLPLLYYVSFLASLSLSLAVFNLLPIPILDGGHLLLLTMEVLRRRRLEPDMQRAAQLVGIAIIGTLFVLILWKDLSKHIG